MKDSTARNIISFGLFIGFLIVVSLSHQLPYLIIPASIIALLCLFAYPRYVSKHYMTPEKYWAMKHIENAGGVTVRVWFVDYVNNEVTSVEGVWVHNTFFTKEGKSGQRDREYFTDQEQANNALNDPQNKIKILQGMLRETGDSE